MTHDRQWLVDMLCDRLGARSEDVGVDVRLVGPGFRMAVSMDGLVVDVWCGRNRCHMEYEGIGWMQFESVCDAVDLLGYVR